MITERFTDRLERISCPEKVKAGDISWLIGIAKAALALSSKMVDTEEVIDVSEKKDPDAIPQVKSIFDVEEEWANLTAAFMEE